MLLPLLGIFATAFIVGLSGAMMPGPLLAVTVDESIRRGARAGPLLVLGHMLLESALVAAIAVGLAGILRHTVVVGLIGFAGGAAMCWMGQGMVRSAGGLSLQIRRRTGSRLHPVVAGIVVSLANPYWTIWWATIGAGYVIIGLKWGVAGVLAFFAGHILADFAWYTLVSAAVAGGRRFISDRVYRVGVTLCGAALIAFGLWFFWTGLHAVLRAE